MHEARELASEVARLKRKVRDLETAASFSSSSIEGGFTPVYDDGGTIRQVIGAQVDGTFTFTDLNGPAPVAPADPIVTTQPGLLIVSSYGLTTDGSDWPLDFLRIDVHVGTTSGFTPSPASKVAEFTIDGGSITLALDPGTYYVVLVAVNTSGNASEPSGEVSALVPLPTTGAGGVKTYHTDDAPVGLTAADDGAIWYETDNGNLPHRWDGITLAWIALPIGSGAIDGYAVGVDHLTVGVGQNSITNPGMETGSTDPHYAGYDPGNLLSATTNPIRSGTYGMRLQAGSPHSGGVILATFNGNRTDPKRHLPVSPGDEIHAEFWIRAGAVNGQTAQIYLETMDATGTHLSYATVPTITLTGTHQRLATSFVVDDPTAAFVCVSIGTNNCAAGDVFHIDDVLLAKKTTNPLLADDAVDGKTITGATILAYDSLGQVTVNIDGETGNVTTRGEFGTSTPDAAGVRISSNEFSGIYGLATYPTIVWNNGSQAVTGYRQPQIFTDTVQDPNLYMWGGSSDTSLMPQVKLDLGMARIGLEATAGSNEVDGAHVTVTDGFISIACDGPIEITNADQSEFGALEAKTLDLTDKLSVAGNASITGQVNAGILQCGGTIQTAATAFQFTGAGGGAFKEIRAASVVAEAGDVTIANLAGGGLTGASIGNQGVIKRSSSSLRYKEAIEPLSMEEARTVLALEPVSFHLKEEADEPNRRRYPGFIAEQVAEAGAELWVARDAEGRPDGVRYPEISAALLALVRDLTERVEALEAT